MGNRHDVEDMIDKYVIINAARVCNYDSLTQGDLPSHLVHQVQINVCASKYCGNKIESQLEKVKSKLITFFQPVQLYLTA